MNTKDITFNSEGLSCKGWLYYPEEASAENKVPVIVMAHGLGFVKEAFLNRYAEKFANNGFAALVFDYRNFGESDGDTRQHIDPQEQIKDYRNAITWVSQLPEINKDQIGIWGTSFSGGHVLWIGAVDKRVKAVVSQAPTINGWKSAERKMGREKMKDFLNQLIAYRESRYNNRDLQHIAMVSNDGTPSAQPHPNAFKWFTNTKKTVAPNLENWITLDSMEKYIEYDPAGLIDLISPTPLLMIIAENDEITPPDLAIHAFESHASEPKHLVKLPEGHFDVYDGETFPEASDAAVDWFVKYLK